MTKTRIRGVYKHPSGGYIARLRFRGISTSKTFSSMASAERWMNRTKGGLATGDVVVYQGDLLSKEQAEARSRADANHTITLLIERFSDRHLRPPWGVYSVHWWDRAASRRSVSK